MPIHKKIGRFIKGGGVPGVVFRQGQSLVGRIDNALNSTAGQEAVSPFLEQQQEFQQQLEEFIARISDPGFGFPQFERLAARAAPTPGTIAGATAAAGGSRAQGREALQAFAQRARAQAFNQFRQFRTGLAGIEGQARFQLAQLPLEAGELALEGQTFDTNRGDALLNAGLEVIGGAIGTAVGGGVSGRQQTVGPGTSFELNQLTESGTFGSPGPGGGSVNSPNVLNQIVSPFRNFGRPSGLTPFGPR